MRSLVSGSDCLSLAKMRSGFSELHSSESTHSLLLKGLVIISIALLEQELIQVLPCPSTSSVGKSAFPGTGFLSEDPGSSPSDIHSSGVRQSNSSLSNT